MRQWTVQRNTKERSRNHCCRKKKKYYTFWVCVCNLSYSTCNAHAPYCIVTWNLSSCTILNTWVRASWIECNNCPTRGDLFSLLHFCRQLYMFQVLTPIVRSSYNCNYSFWYWLTGSTTIRSRCWVGTDSCVSYGRYSFVMNNYLPYDTHESVPTQQRERMVVDPVNQYQKL